MIELKRLEYLQTIEYLLLAARILEDILNRQDKNMLSNAENIELLNTMNNLREQAVITKNRLDKLENI